MTEPDAIPADHQQVWQSLHHPIAWHERVHAFIVNGSFVFVLVDTNSDLREIELTVYFRRKDRWYEVHNQDDVGEIGMADHAGYGWIYGGARAGTTVTVGYGAQRHTVTADPNDHWAFGDESGEFASTPTRLG